MPETTDDATPRDRGPASKGNRRAVLVSAASVAIAAPAIFLFAYLPWRESRDRDLDAAVLRDVAHQLHWYVPQHIDLLPWGAWKSFAAEPAPYPVSRIQKGVGSEERGISWIADLLPYHENVVMFSHIDAAVPWDDPANAVVARHGISRNSTDPKQFAYILPASPAGPSASPFVGIAGVGVDSGSLPASDPRVGAFGFGRQTAMADIKDGLATSMIVATTGEMCGHWLAGDRGTVRGLDPTRQPYVGKSRQFGRGGGAAVLFADGSVRMIAESVAPRVFEAMATIHGGDAVKEADLGELRYPPEE